MTANSKCVRAKVTPEEDGENRGMAMMICPVCGKRIRETDIERYFEENSANTVELCTDCREEFEGDNNLQIDSDTLNSDIYGKLLGFAAASAMEANEERQGLNELTAPLVAAALDGDAWQSGGGIWLIVKRTTDGRVVTISPEVINEYANEEAFEEDRPKSSLVMA
jgi:hypothetical protein